MAHDRRCQSSSSGTSSCVEERSGNDLSNGKVKSVHERARRMTSWYKSVCGETGISFLSFSLFGVVCLPASMSKSQLKAKHLEDERNKAHYRRCVPPCKHYMSTGDTHSLCVACLGARHAESALEGVNNARIESSSHCLCFVPGRLCLMRGEPSRSPRCWSSYRRGGAALALVGFAVRSDGGIGDECVSISVLTHQILLLLPEIGSPHCVFFPSGSLLSASYIFF